MLCLPIKQPVAVASLAVSKELAARELTAAGIAWLIVPLGVVLPVGLLVGCCLLGVLSISIDV